MSTDTPAEGLPSSAYADADLENYTPTQLEELAATIARAKAVPDQFTEIAKAIDKRLKAYYRGLADSLDHEIVPRTQALDAGLPALPQLPEAPPSIGDVNLLMNGVSLVRAPYSDVLMGLARDLIIKTKGVLPEMSVQYVVDGPQQVPRMVVQWTISRVLSANELHALLQLIGLTYEKKVTGYKTTGAGWQITQVHQDMRGHTPDSSKQGIYLGPSNFYGASVNGIFVYRKFKGKGEADHLRQLHPIDWMSRFVGPVRRTQTVIEFKDSGKMQDGSGLSQDMFLNCVVQLSYLLKHNALIERAPLWAAIFRELNKVGTKTINREGLYGTEHTLETIESVMLLPYEQPELAKILNIEGESVLLIGVPGVGKTLLEHYLMISGYNAIFAAVDSDALRSDLTKMGENEGSSSILMRVDSIIRRCTLPVILIIDDIDVILKDEGVISKFLNMMQGIRQKGLLVFASTNYPEKIDPRLLEPGRLSKVIHVPLPAEDDRYGVIMVYLKHLPFASDEGREQAARAMAQRTEGWSHRYLWELIQEASRQCAKVVLASGSTEPFLALDHFEAVYPKLAVRVAKADLTAWDNRIEQMVATQARMGF